MCVRVCGYFESELYKDRPTGREGGAGTHEEALKKAALNEEASKEAAY